MHCVNMAFVSVANIDATRHARVFFTHGDAITLHKSTTRFHSWLMVGDD